MTTIEIRGAMDFRERAAGIRVPRLRERQAAQELEVECKCGHVGVLHDVKWFGLAGKFMGTCVNCLHSPTFTVPESLR